MLLQNETAAICVIFLLVLVFFGAIGATIDKSNGLRGFLLGAFLPLIGWIIAHFFNKSDERAASLQKEVEDLWSKSQGGGSTTGSGS